MSEPTIHFFDSEGREIVNNPELNPSSHIYYHHEPVKPMLSVDFEKNSRGITWSVKVANASTVEEAMGLLDKAREEMAYRFGSVQVR